MPSRVAWRAGHVCWTRPAVWMAAPSVRQSTWTGAGALHMESRRRFAMMASRSIILHSRIGPELAENWPIISPEYPLPRGVEHCGRRYCSVTIASATKSTAEKARSGQGPKTRMMACTKSIAKGSAGRAGRGKSGRPAAVFPCSSSSSSGSALVPLSQHTHSHLSPTLPHLLPPGHQ